MADRNEKTPGNAPGRYYVDTTCTDCDLCRNIAPSIFVRDEEAGQTFVQRQPVNDEEVARADEAVESCPTESIGNDG